mgnify:CR=1 FL=1
MQKTTIYLDERELRGLKTLAARVPGGTMTRLIRKAIRDLLGRGLEIPRYSFLKKTLRKKPTLTSFGEAVRYQRALRKEWP